MGLLQECEKSGHNIIRSRRYCKEFKKPFSMYVYYCETCQRPVATQFIEYPGDIKDYPTFSDVNSGRVSKKDIPKAQLQETQDIMPGGE